MKWLNVNCAISRLLRRVKTLPCLNSASTGPAGITASMPRFVPSSQPMSLQVDTVRLAESPSYLRGSSLRAVDVRDGIASIAPMLMQAVENVSPSHRCTTSTVVLQCRECLRYAGQGRYTLYLCTKHKGLTLVCTDCQTLHDAGHDLANDWNDESY